jgi:hypothetical protein
MNLLCPIVRRVRRPLIDAEPFPKLGAAEAVTPIVPVEAEVEVSSVKDESGVAAELVSEPAPVTRGPGGKPRKAT